MQDALRPPGAWGATWRLALRIGLLAGLPVAAAGALALALANGLFAHDPLALAPLIAHLALPACLLATLVFLALAGLELVVLARTAMPRVERLSGALTAIGGFGAILLALMVMRRGETSLPAPALIALAVVAALAGYSAFSLVRGGLLALGIARTGRAPVGRRARSWVVGLGALAAAALAIAPAMLAARVGGGTHTDQLPSRPGAPVVMVGIDGVLGSELDYLMSRGDLPALAALGASQFVYRRPAGPPAALWTTVATGVGPELHEVRAVDGFEPVGVGTPLVAPAALRWWWERVMEPIGLVAHRPSLSSRRNAAFLWELLARGGDPVVVVDWWSTFPAAPTAGAVVAHGAWQLLEAGAEAGIASSPETLEVVKAVAPQAVAEARRWLAGVPDAAIAERVAAFAIAPDLAAVAAARQLWARHQPRMLAVYLAGPDLLATEGLPPLAVADLLRAELGLLDALVAEVAQPGVAVAVVVDPGRRGDTLGRVLLRPVEGKCPTIAGEVAVGAIAAALAREAGLPASGETPLPPDVCRWPAPPAVVPSWGRTARAPSTDSDAQEYLESLRALGYL